MNRTLKVYTKTDHLFAEFTFYYDQPRQVNAHYTLYRRLYNDDEEDEGKSVYPSDDRDIYVDYREFRSIDEAKAHDKDLVKKEVGRDMTDPQDSYRYVYPTDPVLVRYVAANDARIFGLIDVRFSFINNTKELKFYSAEEPRFDFDISANSLETNLSCIAKIPVYWNREPYEISPYDLKRLPEWY
jgi:hypothetical protein